MEGIWNPWQQDSTMPPDLSLLNQLEKLSIDLMEYQRPISTSTVREIQKKMYRRLHSVRHETVVLSARSGTA